MTDQRKPPVKSYCGGKPNYCTPEGTFTPKRKWVGLTEDEALDLLPVGDWEVESTLVFAKAIEDRLKEKNT